MDLDTVYGRNKTIADILRVGEGGKLKVDTYLGTVFGRLPFTFSNLPPSQNSTGLSSDTSLLAQPRDQIQTAGDKRVADNVSLFLFHTLFLREHNRIATEMSQSHPSMTDEMIYQKARSINIAQFQNIVLYEYLASLLGDHFDDLVGQYQGYSEEVDPSTSLIFAAVVYRFGHSALTSYAPLDTCGDISTLVIPPFLPPGSDVPSIGKFNNTIKHNTTNLCLVH